MTSTRSLPNVSGYDARCTLVGAGMNRPFTSVTWLRGAKGNMMNSAFYVAHAAGLAVGISLLGTTAMAQQLVGGLQIFDKTSGVRNAEVVAPGANEGGFRAVAEDLRSRIITTGGFDSGGVTHLFVSRYNQDGSADAANFGSGGVTTFSSSPSGQDTPFDIGVDGASRIYVLASGSEVGLYVVRFLTNGAPDNNYNHGSPFKVVCDTCSSGTLDVDASGNTAVASANGHGFALAQVDPSGNEFVFNSNTGFDDQPLQESVGAVRLDSLGRTVVVGMSSVGFFAVRRFTSGQPDLSFGPSRGAFYQSFGYGRQGATDATIDSSGNIFVVGTRQDATDFSAHFMLMEFTTAGAPVRQGDFKRGSNFAPPGGYFPYKIALAGTSLYIGGNSYVGHASRQEFSIFKMSTSFVFDVNFGSNGYVEDFVSGYSSGACLGFAYDPRTKNPVLVGVAF